MKKRSKRHIHTISDAEREAFSKQANEAYAAMKNDPEQWQEHLEEIALWEITLSEWNSEYDDEDYAHLQIK